MRVCENGRVATWQHQLQVLRRTGICIEQPPHGSQAWLHDGMILLWLQASYFFLVQRGEM